MAQTATGDPVFSVTYTDSTTDAMYGVAPVYGGTAVAPYGGTTYGVMQGRDYYVPIQTSLTYETTASWTIADNAPIEYEVQQEVISPEGLEALHRQRQAVIEEQQRFAEVQEKARVRADKLLRSILTAKERKELEVHNYVTVRCGLRTFRVYANRGIAGNIHEYVLGRRIAKYCAGAYGNLPKGDVLASQILALKTDHRRLLRVANKLS